jgi:hypothetical protein
MLVPPPVQHEIAAKAPLVAYVPARLAPGWKYVAWQAPQGDLQIVFAKGGRQIVFLAQRYRGDCTIGMRKSFQMAGVKVYYTSTAAEQRAWRCVNGMRLIAATSLPPDRFADVGLGRLAASAHRITA